MCVSRTYRSCKYMQSVSRGTGLRVAGLGNCGFDKEDIVRARAGGFEVKLAACSAPLLECVVLRHEGSLIRY